MVKAARDVYAPVPPSVHIMVVKLADIMVAALPVVGVR
jgi:1,2-phenylacetyl-CoA epoxidase PaaB subunit